MTHLVKFQKQPTHKFNRPTFSVLFSGEDKVDKVPKPDENKYSSPSMVPGVPNESENALATFLDIAVIRCLFISHWSEDGVFWGLMFLSRR